MIEKKKISTFELLCDLQEEYIQTLIRIKVYPRKKDKVFFKELLAKKESKIDSISKRNRINTLLDSSEEKSFWWGKVLQDFGMPNFNYTNKYDMPSYFGKEIRGTPMIGTTVLVESDLFSSERTLAIVDSVDHDKGVVVVKSNPLPVCEYNLGYPIPKESVRPLTQEENDIHFFHYHNSEMFLKGGGLSLKRVVSKGLDVSNDFDTVRVVDDKGHKSLVKISDRVLKRVV